MSQLQPSPSHLHTDRLILRIPELSDADAITALAHNPKIASMTATIPYPYPRAAAEGWIEHVVTMRQQGLIWAYLICQRHSAEVMGVVSLKRMSNLELNFAYWLGEPHWGHGFCAEAGEMLLNMAKTLKASPIIARHLEGNEASKRVLLRLGFQSTGREIADHRDDGHVVILCYRYPSLDLE